MNKENKEQKINLFRTLSIGLFIGLLMGVFIGVGYGLLFGSFAALIGEVFTILWENKK